MNDNAVQTLPTSREEKIATLRRNGYSPERLAALSDGSPAPEVPNDLIEETDMEIAAREIAEIVQPEIDAVIAALPHA